MTRGPVPKANPVRRNATPGRARIEAAPADVPELPSPPYEDGWHPMALAWWSAVSCSPWHHLFMETDWQTAIRGVLLVDMLWRKPTSQLAGEIRQIETKLGCTVSDRAHLGWTIDPPPPASEADGEASRGSRSRPDPRRRKDP